MKKIDLKLTENLFLFYLQPTNAYFFNILKRVTTIRTIFSKNLFIEIDFKL